MYEYAPQDHGATVFLYVPSLELCRRPGNRFEGSNYLFCGFPLVFGGWADFLINPNPISAVHVDVIARISLRNPTLGGTSRQLRLLTVVALVAALLGAAAPAAAQAQQFCGGQRATIVGTPGADVLTGTSGPDVIVALGGNDVVYGKDGHDIICGGHGNDRLHGGDGSDTIYAFNGSDFLEGGKGYDTLYAGAGADVLWGGTGQDSLFGGPGVDTLRGGAQRDNLRGGLHVDTLFGGTELDTCYSPGDSLNECERGGGNANAVVAGPTLAAQYTDEMFRLINIERGKVSSLGAVSRSAELDAYAQAWAVVMSQQPLVNGSLSSANHHSPAFPQGNQQVNFQPLPSTPNWNRAYENVGRATVGTGESVADVMGRLFYSPGGSGFMTSHGHRCNILQTAVTNVGVGVHIDSSGAVWVVQVFSGNQSPVPSPISGC